MRTEEKIIGIACVFAIIVFGQLIFTSGWREETREYEIYKATVPFGVFMVEGNMGGVMFLGTGVISGGISSEETYFLKYFDGDELKSLSLEADEVSIIVDGTFKLEEEIHIRTSWFMTWKSEEECCWLTKYRIHIPYLPTINQTLTEDWQLGK